MAVPGMVGGGGKPFVKFNAKAGRFAIDGKEYTSITMIVDVERAEAGWARFAEASAPQFQLVPIRDLLSGKPYPPMPPDVDSSGKPPGVTIYQS